MSETAEHPTTPTVTTDPRPVDRREPSRLNQVLAWVGIVAGVVFVVAVVFFSGFFLGKHSGGSHGFGHHMKGMHMIHRGGPPPMGPWGPGPGGPGGPGSQAPGGAPSGPGGPGGPSGPSTPPTSHP
ncbi:MAG TPA: hypothetical protein VFB19_16295 [Mycobacterium sp.]|nr:hypothetical protein [Mycobacterium sp.]